MKKTTPKRSGVKPFLGGLMLGVTSGAALFAYLGGLAQGDYPTTQRILLGDQTGFPESEPGEFRYRTADGFGTTKMTQREYLTISNAVHRMRYFHDKPWPGGSAGFR
jgi:hypothetical protein